MRSDATHVHKTAGASLADSERARWFEDDSEWEYEYDEHNTQDIFFTLDLTTHLPDGPKKPVAGANGKYARGTLDARTRKKDPMLKKKAPVPPNALAEDLNNIFDEQTPAPLDPSLEPGTEATPEQNDQETADDVVQFIGLDTASPYVAFNDNFYSAYWLSDLGTQLWVSRPGISESAIYKGYVMDIIGASQVRLIAKPARYHPRELQAPATETQRTDSSEAHDRPTVRHTGQDRATRTHASFMERFAAIKRRKGELDHMPQQSVRYYEFPSNAQEIRDAALAEDQAALRLDDGSFASRVPHQKDVDMSVRIERSARKDAARKRKAEASDADSDDNDTVTPRRVRRPDERYAAHEKRMAALGLPLEPRPGAPVRRKRRTKLEMEEARRRGEK